MVGVRHGLGAPVVAVALAVLASGCTSGGGGGAAPLPEASALETSGESFLNGTAANATPVTAPLPRIFMDGLRLHWSITPFPMSEVQDRLPSGFRVVPGANSASGLGGGYLMAFAFQNATVNGTDHPAAALFFAGFQVSPPSEYQNDSVFNEHIGRFIGGTEELGAVLDEWTAGESGTVGVNPLPGGAGAAVAATAGGASYEFLAPTGPAVPLLGFAEPTSVRFWIVNGTEVEGEVWVTMGEQIPVAAGTSAYRATGAPAPFQRPAGAGLGILWSSDYAAWDYRPWAPEAA